MEDQVAFYDKPSRDQKHPHYEHRCAKLYRKNNEFTNKKFQDVRGVSTRKKLVSSFKRIGKCLNELTPADIPTAGLQKVCFVLINCFEHDKHDPKVGPMNDGYLIALHHHRLGYKVFYLYNCNSSQYPQFLEFFMKYTLTQITVFYSGRDSIINGSHGIEFKDNTISCGELGKLISENYNGRCKAVFISDSTAGGSVFDINSVPEGSDIISLSASKSTDPDTKEGRRSHGIFTYYMCRIFNECPNISPDRLVERMNSSLERFNIGFNCQVTKPESGSQPIFDTE